MTDGARSTPHIYGKSSNEYAAPEYDELWGSQAQNLKCQHGLDYIVTVQNVEGWFLP